LDGSLQLAGQGTGTIEHGIQVAQQGVASNHCNVVSSISAITTPTITNSVQYFDLCTVSGATLSLQEFINADLNGGLQWSATANFGDTSSIFVDALTTGAIVSSASGITYSTPSSIVPEPPGFL
jgi:hypothetical protein